MCLSCGLTSSRLSREHVFPRWLQDYLSAKNVALGLYRRNSDGSGKRVRPDVSLNSFALRRICENCNNGWMSKLEERAKPVLIGLLSNSKAQESFNIDQQYSLARWAAKTAIVESHAVGSESPVPANLLQWMRTHEGDAPGRFGVAVASTKDLSQNKRINWEGNAGRFCSSIPHGRYRARCGVPRPPCLKLSDREDRDWDRSAHALSNQPWCWWRRSSPR